MVRRLRLTRDRYGQVQSATFDRPVHRKYNKEYSYGRSGVREVIAYKGLGNWRCPVQRGVGAGER